MLCFKKLKISPLSLVFVFLLFFSDFSVYTAIVLLAAAAHEAGHLIAMRILGCKIHSICLYPFGVDIKANVLHLCYAKELWVYISGPLVNFVCFAVFYMLALVLPSSTITTPFVFFAFSSFLLFFVNLLPIKTLDGGKSLYCLLCLCGKKSLLNIDSICDLACWISIFILLIFALFVLHITNYNFSLLIFCAYLIISIYAKNSL